MKRNLLTTLILIVLPLLSIAQNNSSGNDVKDLKKAIDKALSKLSDPIFDDSVAVYSFLFNVEISTIKGNKTKVTKLSVSDTLAYKVFTKYKELYTVDFSVVMKGKKKVNLILPVLIFGANSYDRPEIKYLQKNGNLLNVYSLADLFKQSFTSLLPPDEMWLDDVVLFKPKVIHIFHSIRCGPSPVMKTPSAVNEKLAPINIKL